MTHPKRTFLVSTLCLQLAVAPVLAGQGTQSVPALAPWRDGLSLVKADFPGSARWKATTPYKLQTPDGVLTVQTFSRFVNFGLRPLSVANVTYLVIPKTGEWAKADAQKFMSTIQETLKTPDWQTRKQSGADVFAADWYQGNRFVQVFYKDYSNRVEVSIAATRRIFAYPVALEAELLQRRLASDPKVALLEWLQKGFAVLDPGLDANADLTSVLSGLGISGGSSTSSIASTLSGANANLSGISSAIQNGVSTASTLGTNAVNAVNGVQNTARGITNQVTSTALTVSTQVTSSVNGLSKSVEDASGAVNHASDTVKQVISPRNAALMSAASVASGFATTALLGVGLAGIAEGISALYYFAIGRLNPHDREKLKAKVGEAVEAIKKDSAQLAELERNADYELALLGQAAGAGNAEQLAILAAARVEELENTLTRDKEQLRGLVAPSEISACTTQMGATRVALDNANDLYQNVRKIIGHSSDPNAVLCAHANSFLQAWANLESDIDNARQVLLNNEQIVIAAYGDAVAGAFTQNASSRRQNGECEASMKNLKKAEDALEKSVKECVKAKLSESDPETTDAILAECKLQESKHAAIEIQQEQIKTACGDIRRDQDGQISEDQILQANAAVQKQLAFAKQSFAQLRSQGAFEASQAKQSEMWDKAAQFCPNLQAMRTVNQKIAETVQSASQPEPQKQESSGNWFTRFFSSFPKGEARSSADNLYHGS